MSNLNLDLSDLMSELDAVAASKTKGGKKVPEYSREEIAMIQQLVDVSLNGSASQRDIVAIYKAAFKAGKHVEKFKYVHPQRTPASFERKFLKLYKATKENQVQIDG